MRLQPQPSTSNPVASDLAEFTPLIDSREKHPYNLPGARRKALKTGDYSIEGFEDRIAIERKSWEDLYSCLTSRLARFRRQLKRLAEMEYSCLIVDSSVTAILFGHPFHSISGPQALERLLRLTVALKIPVYFSDHKGEVLVGYLLSLYWRFARESEGKRDRKGGGKKASA